MTRPPRQHDWMNFLEPKPCTRMRTLCVFFDIANYMYVYCTVYSSRGGDMQITPILYNLQKNFGKDWDHAT